jgi:hypothetical protein
VSRWLRIADLPPEPDPPPPEPSEPMHLPRVEDPFTRRSRRTAEVVSAAVHVILVLVVLLVPGEALRRQAQRTPTPAEKVPVTFQEFRPAPPPRPAPRSTQDASSSQGELTAPRAAAPPVEAPDNRPAAPAPPRPQEGPDQAPVPAPGGSVLPEEQGATNRPPPANRPGTRPFDLNRAMQDFRRRVPPADPREGPATGSAPTGQGTGRGIPMFGTTGFGVGNLEFESRDYDWTDYYRQIYLAVLSAWYSRLYQTTERFEKFALDRSDWSLDHSARVRFTILRSGQVVDVAIEGASGCVPLDDSAADALREVVLPPLPDDFKRDRETVHGRFIAIGDVRGMRRSLEQARAAGIF